MTYALNADVRLCIHLFQKQCQHACGACAVLARCPSRCASHQGTYVYTPVTIFAACCKTPQTPTQDTKVRSAKCPEGMLLRVKLAEYGAGIFSDDATKKEALQKQCPVGSNECTFDLTKILTTAADLKGQAMRVEVSWLVDSTPC